MLTCLVTQRSGRPVHSLPSFVRCRCCYHQLVASAPSWCDCRGQCSNVKCYLLLRLLSTASPLWHASLEDSAAQAKKVGVCPMQTAESRSQLPQPVCESPRIACGWALRCKRVVQHSIKLGGLSRSSIVGSPQETEYWGTSLLSRNPRKRHVHSAPVP